MTAASYKRLLTEEAYEIVEGLNGGTKRFKLLSGAAYYLNLTPSGLQCLAEQDTNFAVLA